MRCKVGCRAFSPVLVLSSVLLPSLDDKHFSVSIGKSFTPVAGPVVAPNTGFLRHLIFTGGTTSEVLPVMMDPYIFL